MNKIFEVLRSQNFLISVITALLGVVGATAVEVQEIWGLLVGMLIPNVVTPIVKIARSWIANGVNWGFLRSMNFWTQIAVSVELVLIALFPNLPEGSLSELIRLLAEFGLTAPVFTHLLNMVFHLLRPAKG
jgi:hypothetical protein